MSKAPSTYSAMVILAVFLCLAMTQHEANACSECLCFSDNSCTDEDCGNVTHANCTRTVFTVTCNANYTFATSTSCTGGANCAKCLSCADLYKLDGTTETLIANCHTTNCGAGSCNYANMTTYALDPTKTYVMYVCKLPCGAESCTTCNANCSAHACLSYAVTACNP